MKNLINNIQSIIYKAGGEWGVVLEDMEKGDIWEENKDTVFYPASIVKLPVMATVFSESRKGKVDLNDYVTLKEEEMVGGSGVLQHMTPGTKLTINDLITLMIIQSDNTATNILVELVDKSKIKEVMKEIGMVSSNFHHKLMTGDVNKNRKNGTTSNDMAVFLRGLHNGKIISKEASKKMIEIMKKQQIRDCLPANLPYQELGKVEQSHVWELANKTGWVPGTRHDVGIFKLNNRTFIASILSKDVDDSVSKQAIADIGENIYRYFRE